MPNKFQPIYYDMISLTINNLLILPITAFRFVTNRSLTTLAIAQLMCISLVAVALAAITPASDALAADSSQIIDTIPVELTTTVGHQQEFYEGDEIQFLLSLGDDAYIYMYHVDAKGKIVQILPSSKQSSHFYEKGFFLTVPNYEDLYRFIVSRPYGASSIWVFASNTEVISLSSEIDSISNIREKIKSNSTTAFGESHIKIIGHEKQQ